MGENSFALMNKSSVWSAWGWGWLWDMVVNASLEFYLKARSGEIWPMGAWPPTATRSMTQVVASAFLMAGEA